MTEAQTALVEAYLDTAFTIARKLAGVSRIGFPQEDAEWVALNSLMEAAKYYKPGHKSGAGFRTYLTTSIRRDLRAAETKWVKRNANVYSLDTAIETDGYSGWDTYADTIPDESSLEADMVARHGLGYVWNAVDNLTPRQRQIVLMIHKYGLSKRVVARAIRTTTQNVDGNLRRAYAQLRKTLTPDGLPVEVQHA